MPLVALHCEREKPAVAAEGHHDQLVAPLELCFQRQLDASTRCLSASSNVDHDDPAATTLLQVLVRWGWCWSSLSSVSRYY